MKKIFLYIALLIIVALSNMSCSDYLNIVPEGTPTIDNPFSNRINALNALGGCYGYLPNCVNPGQGPGFLSCDEHWLIPKGTGFIESRFGWSNYIPAWELARGTQNSNNPYLNYWDGLEGGRNLWTVIRDCNIFLNNIHKPWDLSAAERNRWISEVKFLKAYYHFFLFQLYGPIPIMDEEVSIDASIEEVRRYRDSVDDVVTYIVNLLDESMENLPDIVPNDAEELGRITKPIAKAVKAQLLLLAASPLFNGNEDYVNIVDKRGVALFPKEKDINKWKLAADAALDAINTAEAAGHGLYYFQTTAGVSMSSATRKLLDIGEAVTERWNREIIWGSTHTTSLLQAVSVAKWAADINKSAVRSLMAPTLDVAEQFYSSNGVPISEDNSTYWQTEYLNRYDYTNITNEGNNTYYMELNQQTAKLHFNREPRFYATLFFDRGTWFGSGMANDAQATLKKFRFRRQEYSGLLSSEDYSITGYLNKKVCSYRTNPSSSALNEYRYSFPIIRLADLYLMYAEALNEYEGPSDEVYNAIDTVRARAGLKGVVESWRDHSIYPNTPSSQEGLRKIIRMERLNELACEGKRFWDMRRWKIEMPSQIRGWNVNGETVSTFYQTKVIFERPKFTYKEYLWPLSISAIQRNPNLLQNPGW